MLLQSALTGGLAGAPYKEKRSGALRVLESLTGLAAYNALRCPVWNGTKAEIKNSNCRTVHHASEKQGKPKMVAKVGNKSFVFKRHLPSESVCWEEKAIKYEAISINRDHIEICEPPLAFSVSSHTSCSLGHTQITALCPTHQ